MYQLSSFIQAAQHHTFAEHLYSVPEIILDKVLRNFGLTLTDLYYSSGPDTLFTQTRVTNCCQISYTPPEILFEITRFRNLKLTKLVWYM